jgi:anti-anti-sigma regulatory factor
MILTISLRHVLREAVATPYRNLVTRATGAAVRGRIEAELAGSDCRTALLDFSEVDLLDFSCADEIVAKLLLTAASGERVLVLVGVREEQREALEHVLSHHRLAVAVRFHGSDAADLLGWIRPDARALFGALREAGAGDARDLALRLGWPAARAEAALDELAAHRLARLAGGRFHPPALP